MRAIVNPAKAPPKSTKPTATARYIHNVGSSGGTPSSSSAKDLKGNRVGAARKKGRLAMAKSKSFVIERIVGRRATRSCLGPVTALGAPTRGDIVIYDTVGDRSGALAN